MDFTLSKEHAMLRKMYREFTENEVKPLAAEIDEEERFPMETVEKMAKLGMMGIYFPKQYGGAGGGTDAQGQQTAAVLDESGENYILNGSFLTCDYTLDNFMDLYMPHVGARGAKGSAYIEENIDKEMARMLEAHAQHGPKPDDGLKARVREVLMKETGISAQQLDAIEAL